MFRYLLLIYFIINLSFSQDTINFKQYDSLKTSAEDKHKSIINKKDPDNFDVRMFRSINRKRSSFKDAVLPYFDRSAPPLAFIMPMSTLIYGRLSKNHYDENTGYLLGISEGLNLFLTFGTKYIVKRNRPYASLDKVYCKDNIGTDPYSFPSGHTSIAFSIAAMFNLRYPKYPQVYVPMYLYGIIVAYGRPYFGMHYPSDLLGGALIGAGSSILVYSLRSTLFKMKNKILSEEIEDAVSINGNTIAIFGGAFVASSLLGQVLFDDNNKVRLNISPYGSNNEMINFNINVRF